MFELNDLKPQLTKEEYVEMTHILYMAKSLQQAQQVHIGVRHIAIFPSGKMMFFEPKEDKVCPTCGRLKRSET
jgi:hypothetical protein